MKGGGHHMKKWIVMAGMIVVSFCILPPYAVQAGSFFERLLQVTGISATSGTLKGDEDTELTGDIIVVDLSRNSFQRLTDNGGYRSPVFEPGDKAILALKGDTVVRVVLDRGKEEVLYCKKGLTKLVGFDTKDADKLLVLVEGEEGKVSAGFFSLGSGEITTLPYDRNSNDDRRMLGHIRGWERVYGDVRVYPEQRTKRVIGRTVAWTDVFLQRGNEVPLNLSNGDGTGCGQPSLSQNRNLVAYVKQK
jgi:hypothetical protein